MRRKLPADERSEASRNGGSARRSDRGIGGVFPQQAGAKVMPIYQL